MNRRTQILDHPSGQDLQNMVAALEKSLNAVGLDVSVTSDANDQMTWINLGDTGVRIMHQTMYRGMLKHWVISRPPTRLCPNHPSVSNEAIPTTEGKALVKRAIRMVIDAWIDEALSSVDDQLNALER